ncbi:hypothetical protein J7382_14880 [Shimia sp. R11_0]|uniref:hypothetical protein n=1 Tax=Shimia sp. R11_0 TaxID=2821096 RepID=UPI001ADCB110|nr:hypothetical protein [Shimia sp. R11_0]MBO9478830.1 hypothetical protein [Shimia sp. R11_0]
MVEAVGILGESTGWGGLSASQNAMLHAALAKYAGQPAVAPQEPSKPQEVPPIRELVRASRGQNEAQQHKAVDGAVMSAIRSAVTSFERSGGGDFAKVLKAKLDDAGIDSSKSVVDYYA